MVNRQRTVYKKFPTARSILQVAEFGEVEVTQNDTVTFDCLHATKNPLNVVFWKKTDGTEMTNTHAANTNVVTITGAGTSISCLYMAYGYKP